MSQPSAQESSRIGHATPPKAVAGLGAYSVERRGHVPDRRARARLMAGQGRRIGDVVRAIPGNLDYWSKVGLATTAWHGAVVLGTGLPLGAVLSLTAMPLVAAAWCQAWRAGRAEPVAETPPVPGTLGADSLLVHAPVPPRREPAPAGLPRWRVQADRGLRIRPA
jgi:hypothetical protein